MVSYKKLYEKLKKNLTITPYKTNYECPLCGQTIISDGVEFYCAGLDCKFDKTAGELFEYYAINEQLERIGD